MLRGRVASLPRGMPPRFDPQTQGVLPQALRALFSGRSPRCPLFLLVRSKQKPPTPLLYYLSEGEKKFA